MTRSAFAARVAALVAEGEAQENVQLRLDVAELRRQLEDRDIEVGVLREFLSVSLAECHSLTGKLTRAQAVIVHQRDELRRYVRSQFGAAA